MSRVRPKWIVDEIPEIQGRKLPSNRQVLGCFLYHHRRQKMTFREASNVVYHKLMLFWKASGIRTRLKRHVLAQIEKLYQKTYKTVLYGFRNASVNQRSREQTFVDTLDNLFDIAHADALNGAGCEEDKDFLMAQRERGRVGYLPYFIDSVAAESSREMAEDEEVEVQVKIDGVDGDRETST